MITVLLQGRTGNNLFQYATGRALADRLGTDLVLDGSWANPELAGQFEAILRFPLRARYHRRASLAKRVLGKFLKLTPGSLHRGNVHAESSVGPDPSLAGLPDGTMLVGYFQSPLNFSSSANGIRRDLDPTAIQLPGESVQFAESLSSSPTVSLHVRRGDYLGIPSTRCLTDDYHDRAINWFKQGIPGVRFCVFSDDLGWCRARFQGPEFLFCDLPASATDPLHDMLLMARCHHHIIANSSYSWWGAWLNPSGKKMVLAPEEWMVGMDSTPVLEEDWVRL